MSDRRPEHEELSEAFHAGWQALQNDPEALISAVRRGVESGTIKGRVVPHIEDIKTSVELHETGYYILIGPVSDGGSET